MVSGRLIFLAELHREIRTDAHKSGPRKCEFGLNNFRGRDVQCPGNAMFCPQCGTESPADLKFCRTCGTNLRVIGKAVTLSEAIARSDSVPSKIKDLVKNLKVEKVQKKCRARWRR